MYLSQGPQITDRPIYGTGGAAAPLWVPRAQVPTASTATISSVPPTRTAFPIASTVSVGSAVIPPAERVLITERVVHSYGAAPPVVATHAEFVHGPSLFTRCACEFCGTLMLFFVMALCSNFIYYGAFYVALIYAFWYLSGAHLNPAISFAAAIVQKMPLKAFFAYVVAQFLGGALGGLLYKLIFSHTSEATYTLVITPRSPYTLADAITIEMIYTTMLVFVALNVMCTQRNDKNQFFGIAIGFVIVAGSFAGAAVLGAALFNPALCLGLMTSEFKIGACLWYILAEIVSAVIGVVLFKLLRYQDHRVDHDVYEVEHGFTPVHSPRGAMGTALMGTGLSSKYADYQADAPLLARVFSEFLGTFWLVVTIVLNMALSTGYAAWCGAGVLVSLIYTLSGISGAHFNPAVTVAVMVGSNSRCSVKAGICYIVAQFVSAIPAGIIASSLFKETNLFASSSDYGWFPIVFAEFLFTLILAYVVLVVATSETHASYLPASQPNFYYALAIGFLFLGASKAIGTISGGYLNPAVALGLVVDSSYHGSSAVIIRNLCRHLYRLLEYWFPEFFGAIVAAVLFRLSHSWAFMSEVDMKATYVTKPVSVREAVSRPEPASVTQPLAMSRETLPRYPGDLQSSRVIGYVG